ncbi:MAG: peptidylprolyl isomerase [Betaproteobacteria bacterium]|nr:peptidylprolyl isomerase [Betaproteobacteria bacterium]MBK9608403.1 peptidylprolyl isomerase [Betaproteobacteria bacterium]
MHCKFIRAAAVMALASALNGPAALAQVRPQAPAGKVETLDRIVAVVNDEVITKHEMESQKQLVIAQLRRAGTELPAPDVLEKQLLERLINERAQLQWAKDTGIRIEDAQIERTISRIAEDNKLTTPQFLALLKQDNIPYAKFREDLRGEMMLARVREREIENKIVISEAEIDNHLATQATQSGNQQEYRIAHILVLLPEQANAEQINARRARAEDALKQLNEGRDFAQVAAGYSDASDALQGGSLGWRVHGRLPTVFADAVPNLKPGESSGILKSPNGFHIVKVLETRALGGKTVVDQTHARHILIKVNEIVSEADARARIDRIKDRIDRGTARFEDLAKLNSEDLSAAKGGDLGWLGPGATVPEFELAMGRLEINSVSEPVRTPFGWHLIQVLERRKEDVTLEKSREAARSAIRARKSEETYQDWLRQLRDRAYVEYRLEDR